MKWGLFAAVLLLAPVSHRAQAKEPNAPRDVEFKAEVDGTAQKYVEIIPKGWTKVAFRSAQRLLPDPAHQEGLSAA